MLNSEPCAFCKRDVVGPCTNPMLASTCSQRAPAPVQVDSASLLAPVSFTDVHLKQAAEAVAAPSLAPNATAEVASLLREPTQAPSVLTNTPRAGETAEQIAARSAPRSAGPKTQVGGNHYTSMVIQPLTYIQANELDFDEGSVVKYVTRWRKKNGIEDLKKARDMLDKKIAFEQAKEDQGLREYLRGLFAAV